MTDLGTCARCGAIHCSLHYDCHDGPCQHAAVGRSRYCAEHRAMDRETRTAQVVCSLGIVFVVVYTALELAR